MTERRFKIMEDAVTNKEHIVDMSNGEPLTLNETCILLNELYEENQSLRELLNIGKTNAKDIIDVLNQQEQYKIKAIELEEENQTLKEKLSKIEEITIKLKDE